MIYGAMQKAMPLLTDPALKQRFLRIWELLTIDSSRWILVGSNGQNRVVYLKELQIFDDPLVFYNFHYYDPQGFTHQRAHFSDELCEFGQTITYPGDISSFIDFLKFHPEYYTKHALVAKESTNDLALMKRLLQRATDFIQKTGKELYCGDFGLLDHNGNPVSEL